MRACVASVVVERMRMGDSPEEACRYAVSRVRCVIDTRTFVAGNIFSS